MASAAPAAPAVVNSGAEQPAKKKTPSALRSILAGSTAGAVEIGECRVMQIRLAVCLLTVSSHHVPG